MDPDACLRELRELAARDAGTMNDMDVTRMGELVQALDDWLCRRGFMPAAWARGPADTENAYAIGYAVGRSRGRPR